MLEILKKAEVPRRRAIVHVMRHTFASMLIQQGESVTYVKEQMGHSSIQITVEVYGHLVPGGNRAAVDRLDTPANVANNLQTADQPACASLAIVADRLGKSGESYRNRTADRREALQTRRIYP